MRSKHVVLFLALAAVLLFQKSHPLLIQTLIGFNAEDPSTVADLSKADGEGLALDSGLLGSQAGGRAWMKLQLPTDPFFTSVHISAWVEGVGHQSLELVDKFTDKKTVLSRRPVLRHAAFDLTPHLNKEGSHQLFYVAEVDPKMGRAFVQEFFVRRNPSLPRFPSIPFALGVILALWLAVDGLKKKGGVAWDTKVLLGLLWFGLMLRWKELGAQALHPLEGDALGYFHQALAWNWQRPFETGIREPFYIIVQAVILKLGGGDPVAFRSLTVVLSVGLMAATFFFVRKLANDSHIALWACFIMSFNDFLIATSARGERVELYALLLLWFLLAEKPWVQGVSGGLMAATWLVGLPTFLIILLFRKWRSKMSWIHMGVAALIFVAILGPHLYYQKLVNGDPFYALNTHVSYYEGTVDSQTGWLGYLISGKGLIATLFSTMRGYFDLFLNPLSPANRVVLGFHYTSSGSWFFWPFLIAGMALHLKRKEWLPGFLVLTAFHLIPSHLAQVRDPRLFLHAVPFAAYFTATGLAAAVNVARNKAKEKRSIRRKMLG